LRFPAESGDGSVIGAAVWHTPDPEAGAKIRGGALPGQVGLAVTDEAGVGVEARSETSGIGQHLKEQVFSSEGACGSVIAALAARKPEGVSCATSAMAIASRAALSANVV